MKGKKAYHICGTDEHGTPILAKAIKENQSPKEVVDYYHEIIKRAFERTLIHFDIFSRTTKPHHYEMATKFYEKAKKEGYIYFKEVPILYCERDRLALPDRLVTGTCPYCGAPNQYGDHCEACGRTYSAFRLKDPHCTICGATPVIKHSKHAFFALSKFGEKLQKWITEKVKLTKGVREHVLHWIKEGLQDWDITRDINWGVPVPDLPNQVLYVWWDAPVGYISFTKELFDSIGEDWEKAWIEGDSYIVHFIGKDIIYHHVLFWPAMLMANGFSLPNEIRVRGFATLEGKKMSKSRRIYISLEEFLNIWPAEYLRFYWSSTTSESLDDGDFSFREYQERINKVLIGEVGNFIHRVLTLIKRSGITHGDLYSEIILSAKDLLRKFDAEMLNNQFDVGLDIIINLAGIGNKLLSEKEPWKDLKSKVAADTLFTAYALIVALSIVMDPFLPASARRVRELIQIEEPPDQLYSKLDVMLTDKEFISKSINDFLKQVKKIKLIFQRVEEGDINTIRRRLSV